MNATERTQAKLAYLDLLAQRHRDAAEWATRQGDTARADRLRRWLVSIEAQRAELLAKPAAPTAADPVAAARPLPSLRAWADRSPADIAEILVRSITTLTRASLRGEHRNQVTAIATAAAVLLIDRQGEEEAKRLERRQGGDEGPGSSGIGEESTPADGMKYVRFDDRMGTK